MTESASPPCLAFRPAPDDPCWALYAVAHWVLGRVRPECCVGAGGFFAMMRALAVAAGMQAVFDSAETPASGMWDLVVVDAKGAHPRVTDVMEAWGPVLRPAALLLIHRTAGPVLPSSDYDVRWFDFGDGLAIVRRRAEAGLPALWDMSDRSFDAFASRMRQVGETWMLTQKLHEAEQEIGELRLRLRRMSAELSQGHAGLPCLSSPAAPPQERPSIASTLLRSLQAAVQGTARARRQSRAQRRFRAALVASGLFNPAWYLWRYPEVTASGLEPLDYFFTFGLRAGHDATVQFDGNWYLEANPDVAAAGLHPLQHYVLTGKREGRAKRPLPVCGYLPPNTPMERRLGLHLDEASLLPVTIGMVVPSGVPLMRLREAVLAATTALAQIGQAVSGRILVLGLAERIDPTALADTPAAVVPLRGDASATDAHNRLMDMAFGEGAEVYVTVSIDGTLDRHAIVSLLRTVRANGQDVLVGALCMEDMGPPGPPPARIDAHWLSGHCLAIPKRVRTQVGPLDTQFSSHGADLDYSWRARRAGFACLLCPPALFVETGSAWGATCAEALEAGHRLAAKWKGAPIAHPVAERLGARSTPPLSAPLLPHLRGPPGDLGLENLSPAW